METTERTGTNEACRANDDIPVISQKGNLPRDEAVKELQSLEDIVEPRHGWASWVEIKIEQRKVDLARMIANTFLRKD